jgi:hypothetical protein
MVSRTHQRLSGACGAHNSTAYWRTPTKSDGVWLLVMLPRASALPSALIAPVHTMASASVIVNVPSAATA